MFSYTAEEIKDLIVLLEDNGRAVLADFLKDSKDGLSEPGSMNDAMVFNAIETFCPEALTTFRLPKEDLPLYLDPKVFPIESYIASWRLMIGK